MTFVSGLMGGWKRDTPCRKKGRGGRESGEKAQKERKRKKRKKKGLNRGKFMKR